MMTAPNLPKGARPASMVQCKKHITKSFCFGLRTDQSSSSENNDSNGDDYSSSDDSDGSDDPECVQEIALSLQRFQSLHANDHGPATKSSYAKSGMSKSRCKDALKHPPCKCKCTLPLRILVALCQAFWALSKPCQDSLLWSIQLEGGPGLRKKWTLGGYHICRESWLYFLGIGKQRVTRCKRKFHGKDLRSLNGSGGP